MGTIASVLQWQCDNCNSVNPIECVRCNQCDTVRLLNEESSLDEDEDPQQPQTNSESEDSAEQSAEQQCQHAEPATRARGDPKTLHRHQTTTGYLEIRPDG